MQIGIIGSAGPEEYPRGLKPNKKIYKLAERAGELVAQKGAVLITGGKGGIMKAAAIGAKRYGGNTVGIVKGNLRNITNKFIDVEIVSNMGTAGEESILVMSSDGIVAVGGGAGTLQELTIAYRNKKPVVALTGVQGYSSQFAGKFMDGRKLIKIEKANTPEKAVNLLLKKIK